MYSFGGIDSFDHLGEEHDSALCIAGDRVVADPLCKPFSMGRNLFCVHSRKRMDDIPELKAEKQVSLQASTDPFQPVSYCLTPSQMA